MPKGAAPIKTNLIAGFLGSGKTSLIRHFLSHRSGERVAVLLNEAGEESLDPAFLRAARATSVELANGCICCQVSNDFSVALKTLAQTRPDRVLIESTGIAEPPRILKALAESPSLRESFSIEPTVVVVDTAGFFSLFQTLAYFYLMQLRAADVVVLNKTDVATRAQISETEREVRKLNPNALIVRAKRGAVDLHGILEGVPGAKGGSGGFQSCRVALPGTLDAAGVRALMESLPGSVYRAKGRVRFPDGAHQVQYLTGSYAQEPLREPVHGAPNELVFIGSRVNERLLSARLKKCSFSKREND